MTALALGAQKAISFRLSEYGSGFRLRFLAMNRRGILTGGCLALIASAGVSYLLALFMLFHLGLAMQDTSVSLSAVRQDILKDEIILQSGDANFAETNKEILATMEQISSITYIPREHAAAMIGPQNFGKNLSQ